MTIAEALDRYQEKQLRTHEVQQAGDAIHASRVETRTEELRRKLALTADGLTCPLALDEAAGDLFGRPEMVQQVALLKDAGQHNAIGLLLVEWFAHYWHRKCRELAVEQINQEDRRAAEEAAADRFYSRRA